MARRRGPRRIEVTLENGLITARFEYEPRLVAAVRQISGATYDGSDPADKKWLWEPSARVIDALESLGSVISPATERLREVQFADVPRELYQMTPVDVPEGFTWLAATPGRPHQVAASAWRRGCAPDKVIHLNGALEMGLGTGKTLVAIEEILKLKRKQPRAQVLVIAVNSILRKTWEKQLKEHADGQLDVCILDGPTATRRRRLLTEYHDVWVHNCESLGDMGDALREHRFDFIILDEHSKFRNHISARAKVLLGHPARRGGERRGALTSPYKLALSGTPVVKKAQDVYVTYKWLGAPTGTIAQFRERFCVMGGYGGKDELAVKDPQALRNLMDKFRYVVPKTAVLNLPRAFHTHELPMPDWQRDVYTRVQEDLIVKFKEQERRITNPLELLLRLAQVTAGIEALDNERYTWRDDNAKASFLCDDLLPELFDAGKQKVIVWANFRAEIFELGRMLEERGIRAVKFYGGQTDKQNDQAFEEFTEGDAQVFLGNMAKASLGLNLPHAKTMVYYTRTWSTEDYFQSLDRNSRLTTVLDPGDTLNVIILECENSVDQHITRVLGEDVNLAAMLTSLDPKDVLGVKPALQNV